MNTNKNITGKSPCKTALELITNDIDVIDHEVISNEDFSPTMELRFEGSFGDVVTPSGIKPYGYNLQQKWIEESGKIQWRDVPVKKQ